MEWALIDQDGPVRSGRTPDGTRVLWHPADGPTSARLTFRVGVADETLPTRGITHLVEHLAHERIGLPLYEANAHVGVWCTTFSAGGEVDDVTAHLGVLGAALHDLPVGGCEGEIEILLLEAARRAPSQWEDLLVQRYGLRGLGLASVDEVGLDLLRPEQVAEWARTAFTASGAVLSVHGAEPGDEWLQLPVGPPLPPADALPLPDRRSKWFTTSRQAVALGSLGRDEPSTTAAWWWLQRRMRQRLRVEDRAVYDVDMSMFALPHGSIELALAAVTHERRLDDVLAAVQDVVDETCSSTPTQEELAAHARWFARSRSTDRSAVQALDDLARSWLVEGTDPADHPGAVLDPVPSGDEVRRTLARLLDDATWEVPDDCEAPSGLEPLPVLVPAPSLLGGRRFPSRGHLQGPGALVLSAGGVVLDLEEGVTAGMAWEDCVEVRRSSSGVRHLVCVDGNVLPVYPVDWHDSDTVLAVLDELTPPQLVRTIHEDSGDAGAGESSWRGASSDALLLDPLISSAVLLLLSPAMVFFGLLLLVSSPGTTHPLGSGCFAVGLICAGVSCVVAVGQRWRRRWVRWRHRRGQRTGS